MTAVLTTIQDMMKHVIWPLFLIFLFHFGQLLGQQPHWAVLNADNTDMPDNFIKTIVIDSDNNKWIGTANPVRPGGLVKFDNEKWTNFNSKNSKLPNKPINTLHLDREDNIWVGTKEGGLLKSAYLEMEY